MPFAALWYDLYVLTKIHLVTAFDAQPRMTFHCLVATINLSCLFPQLDGDCKKRLQNFLNYKSINNSIYNNIPSLSKLYIPYYANLIFGGVYFTKYSVELSG